MERLLVKLEYKLGMDDPEDDAVRALEGSITEAENDLLLYLNVDCLNHLVRRLEGKILELATINFQQNRARSAMPGGVKSSSYSEGDVSQSVTYLTAQDVQTAKDAVLRSIAQYRRRAKWD